MDAIRRSSIGFGILVAVWIAVYWWWQPAGRTIAFDADAQPASALTPDPASEPPPARVTETAPVPKPAPPSSSPPASLVDGVVAPRFQSYTVRRGDTMESIAQREMGSRDLASTLSRANPLQDPTRLREGQTIQIPLDVRNIQGQEIRRVPVSSVTPRATEYVVKPGDTLAEISRRQYGTTVHWKLILEANRDRLKDERSIRPGQTIVIPALP